MATILDSKITVTPERRPCMVKIGSEEKKALWHMFSSRAHLYPIVVIELEDGSVYEVMVSGIRFLDSKEEFGQYAWEGVE